MILSLSTLTHCKQWLKSLAQKSGFYISRAPMVNLEGFALVDLHIANNDGASSSVFQFSEELGIPNLSMTNSESHSNSGTVCEENRY